MSLRFCQVNCIATALLNQGIVLLSNLCRFTARTLYSLLPKDGQCPTGNRGLGGRTLGAGESEMSDIPIEFGVAFGESETVRFPA
jgi:hypothetical protein